MANVVSKQWMKCPDVSTISRLLSKHLQNLRLKSLNDGCFVIVIVTESTLYPFILRSIRPRIEDR